MRLYKILRAKMIISFESWNRHIMPSVLFQRAILVTIIDKIKLSVQAIQQCLPEGITVEELCE